MRARGAAIQGGLAALGLVMAYTTWQREPERSPGEAVLLDVAKGDISMVRYDDGTKWVELTQEKDDHGPAVWIKLSKNDATKTPERVMRGAEGAVKLWDKFAPLRATRALGVLSADKLKELGLDAPKKHIEITARGAKHVFQIGSPKFNVTEPYVLDETDKRVYVLGGQVVSDLDAAGVRLVDRALHSFKPADFDGIAVSVGNKKRELTQTGQQTPATTKLNSKKSGKPDEQAKNWFDKLTRLYVSDVLGKGEEPKGGKPELALRVDYVDHGKALGWVEIGRVAALTPPVPANTSHPAPAPTTPTSDIYARSEHTAGWVKLPPTAEDILKEADKIVAGE
jgi:hypothetical protein